MRRNAVEIFGCTLQFVFICVRPKWRDERRPLLAAQQRGWVGSSVSADEYYAFALFSVTLSTEPKMGGRAGGVCSLRYMNTDDNSVICTRKKGRGANRVEKRARGEEQRETRSLAQCDCVCGTYRDVRKHQGKIVVGEFRPNKWQTRRRDRLRSELYVNERGTISSLQAFEVMICSTGTHS